MYKKRRKLFEYLTRVYAHPPGDDHPTLGRRVSRFVVASGTSYFLSISPSLFSMIYLSLSIVSTYTVGTGSDIIWYGLTDYKLHTVTYVMYDVYLPIILHAQYTYYILLLNINTIEVRGSKIIACIEYRKSRFIDCALLLI